MSLKSFAKAVYRNVWRYDLCLPSRHGFKFHVVPGDIKGAICVAGFYEREDVRALTSLPVDGGIIIDVGANIGFFSLLLAKAYPRSEVHAFDPSRYNRDRVHQNLTANPKLADRVNFHWMGVGSQRGSLEFFAVPGPAGHAWGRLEEKPVAAIVGAPLESYQVTVDALDNVFEGRIGDVSLIKIDVEGYELEVLKGMRKIIAHQRAIIMFEVSLSYLILHPGQFQDMLKVFDGTSYEKFVPSDKGLIPYTWPHERVFNMYMVPAAKLNAAA